MNAGLLINFFTMMILYYYAGLFLWYLFTLILSFGEIINMAREDHFKEKNNFVQNSDLYISISVPAFNAEKRILNCVYSVLQNNYQHFKLIVVNDGSTDNTLKLLQDEFKLYIVPPVIQQVIKTSPVNNYYQSALYPELMVIDKQHGRYNNPADCHNAAINAISSPVMMTLDADTILEPDALEFALFCFLSQKNCIAVGGGVYVLNDNIVKHGRMLTRNISKRCVVGFQCIEYIRSFTYGRAGYTPLSGSLCYPGAFTLFETQAMREFGGFDPRNVSFDAEIILRFHHQMRNRGYPTRLRYAANARAWTEVPDTWRGYWRQRHFWQRGMLLSALRHIGMLFNPRYGIVGLVLLPTYFAFEIFAPVVEFFSYVLVLLSIFLGIHRWDMLVWYFGLAWSGICILSMGSYYLNLIMMKQYHSKRDLLLYIWYSTIEMFGFRQFRAACCTTATIQFFWRRMFHRFKLSKMSY